MSYFLYLPTHPRAKLTLRFLTGDQATVLRHLSSFFAIPGQRICGSKRFRKSHSRFGSEMSGYERNFDGSGL